MKAAPLACAPSTLPKDMVSGCRYVLRRTLGASLVSGSGVTLAFVLFEPSDGKLSHSVPRGLGAGGRDWQLTVCCCLWPFGKCEPTAANQYIHVNILFNDGAPHNLPSKHEVLTQDLREFASPFTIKLHYNCQKHSFDSLYALQIQASQIAFREEDIVRSRDALSSSAA